ncbi:site-specific integrase [Novosphingobium sp. EMRT-2]|uniref:tyrosine-type recombinase/integrase n=1 Tax=Novosphingobium sp. EMRT-2 TaxID=2571749 RepID=UPI0010BD572C|nr:site-specific integrase [Novosphingobium sp. EMRT-2]QCI95153.1 site-specific integrase [Novosphingobium sp. EMRT-2]
MALKFSRLTRPAIRALEKGQRIHEHGITAERLTSGDVRYSVNVMIDRQRVHRVIGRESEGVTREQAERAIETLRTRAREDRLDLPTGRKTHRTFAEAATEYLQRLEETLSEGQKGFHDLPNKRRNVDKYLSPYFGKHRADKITSFLVKHYQRKRLDDGAKLASVNRELATLSHMMTAMVGWKWIKDTDRPKIEKAEEPRKKIVVLSEANAEALFKGAAGDQDASTWLFVAIGLNTAMRHSEILRIRWDDIDFDRRRIDIPRAKAGQRVQPITATLADTLRKERERRPKGEVWLFPATRDDTKTPHRRDMDRQFQRAVIRAKLDPAKVTPHVMRHTGITRLVMAGVDLPTIQRISGHKTLAMVMRYVHLTDDHIDKSIEAIETGFLDTIAPELHTGTDSPPRRKPRLSLAKG